MTYKEFIDQYEFRHFSGRELAAQAWRVRGVTRNSLPPEKLWKNILPTLRVVDLVREDLGVPLKVTSAYRSPAYNKAVGGASRSQHLRNNALDLIPKGVSPQKLFDALYIARESGLFVGGLGLYNSFVHVDTRGSNATW